MTEFEALLLSAAIEAPVACFAVWLANWPSRGLLHIAAASVVATAATHPQLWTAVLWAYGHWPQWLAISLPELAVVLAEGGLIAWMARLQLVQAMLVSLAANGASLLAGLLLRL